MARAAAAAAVARTELRAREVRHILVLDVAVVVCDVVVVTVVVGDVEPVLVRVEVGVDVGDVRGVVE